MSEEQKTGQSAEVIVIKKYANRRLYNTATSTYVTLDDLSVMVKGGQNFQVVDAKTGEDITRSVLTQIIFEEENKGGAQTLLPVNFLRQLIKFYGDQMQSVVPGYLEFSLDNLMKDQDKIRKQMMDAMGSVGVGSMGLGNLGLGNPMLGMEEQAKRNMAMFSDAMKLFNPFAAAMTGAAPAPAAPKASAQDDLQVLREQMTAMQDKLNKMGK
ncbi:MAG: polyhydroxyalkanoate synthesis repressor PhaR [Pseudomonadota bacterium]|nr:polyhydroxyalkanoate synthesis repressor PhaR [Pseudomonadota bacterium]